MASIQSLGIGSGLLTTELLESIIAAEREATDLRLDAEQAEAEAKLSAFGSIRSALDGLQSAASALKSRTTFANFSSDSSNASVATASTSSLASPGSYSVEVGQLARNQVLATGAYESLDTVVGTGTLNITFGTTAFDIDDNVTGFTVDTTIAGGEIEIDETNNTLSGIRDAINAAGVGIRANIIDDGSGFRLALTSENNGAGGSMSIEVTEGGTAGLSDLAFNATTQNLEQTVKAQDAQVTVDGIAISRSTNAISGVIQGVTFNALSAAPGAPVTLTVERDLDASVEKIESFVSSYNEFKDLLTQLTDFDPDTQEGGLLLGDSALRSTANQLSRLLSGSIDNPFDQNIRALVDIGISTDRSFRLQFSRAAFEAKAADIDALSSVFAANGRTSDSQISFIGAQEHTLSGDYDLTVTRLAQQGFVRSQSITGIAASGVTIDADNSKLRVAVNGIDSGELTLAQGSYTAAEFAAELQLTINSSEILRNNGRSVEVAFDATREFFQITSGSFGSSSKVAITDVGADSTAELGLAVDDGVATAGRDVQVRIGDYTATGNGQTVLVGRRNLGAAPGFLSGATTTDIQAGSITIDATNRTFEITVDGTGSNTIALTEATYTDMDALASEITAQINADANIAGAGAEVSVLYDALNERFEIITDSRGADSTVEITAADAGFTSAVGLSVGVGFSGTDASPVGRDIDVGGLQLGIFGGSVGARGQVEFVRGIADQFDSVLDGLLAASGSLTNREDALRGDLADVDEERTRFDERIAAQEARLRQQFATNDALISQLNSTSDFLSSQLDLLPLANRKND